MTHQKVRELNEWLAECEQNHRAQVAELFAKIARMQPIVDKAVCLAEVAGASDRDWLMPILCAVEDYEKAEEAAKSGT